MKNLNRKIITAFIVFCLIILLAILFCSCNQQCPNTKIEYRDTCINKSYMVFISYDVVKKEIDSIMNVKITDIQSQISAVQNYQSAIFPNIIHWMQVNDDQMRRFVLTLDTKFRVFIDTMNYNYTELESWANSITEGMNIIIEHQIATESIIKDFAVLADSGFVKLANKQCNVDSLIAVIQFEIGNLTFDASDLNDSIAIIISNKFEEILNKIKYENN